MGKGFGRKAGFNVLVRRRGVFSKQNVEPLSKKDALKFGSFKVGTTAAASFKIQPAGMFPKLGKNPFGSGGNLGDFDVKKGIFIERRGRRIKSIGELQEITFKGIRSKRRRK